MTENDRDSAVLRKLINGSTKKGYLYKQGGNMKNWKKRWFCLKGNDFYYFENSQENKLKGKFVIDGDCQISDIPSEKKMKKDFCFQINFRAARKIRYLYAENEKLKKEWISLLEGVIHETNQGKHKCILDGYLYKQPPKGVVWNKRYCVLKDNCLYYFKEKKDCAPAGFIMLKECKGCESAEDIKNFCFFLDHSSRKFYFTADSQLEANQWVDTIRVSMGLELPKPSSRKSFVNIVRESFLCKTIKEGILNKINSGGKSKPVRVVLTPNFVYYFPQANTTQRYHSMHLDDLQTETIPASIEKTPFSFRIVSGIHELLMAADDENEYNTWINVISQAKQTLAFQTASKTEKDIKTNKNIDYSIEILSEKVDKSNKQLGTVKSYDIKVNAFWTSWVICKSWNQISQLYMTLYDHFSDYIFPEMFEEPVFTDEDSKIDRERRRSGSRSRIAAASNLIPFVKFPKTFDKDYDLKFIRCLLLELLRCSEISQSSLMFNFVDLTDIFSAVTRGEIAFVRYFLQQKVQVNVLNVTGFFSPLHLACEKNNKQIVEALIEYGANPNMPNKKGLTPMHFTVETGNKDLFAFLVEKGGNITDSDESGQTLMHLCARLGSTDIINYLIEKSPRHINAQDGGMRTPIHYACIEGHLECVKALVANGANIELQDEEGFTPLMAACWKTHIEVVEFLLTQNARLEQIDKNKRSCVHLAVLRKSDDILQRLIESGATTEAFNGSGFAPIHVAASKGYDTIAELLVSKGASVYSRDENMKQTALHIAVLNNRLGMIELLSRLGGAQLLDCQDKEGKTALHLSLGLETTAAAELLLKVHARTDVHDSNGETPLHTACNKGNLEMVEMLILNNASVLAKQKDGYQPLHLAIMNGNEMLVCFLLGVRAEVNTKDSSGNTPLHLALMKKQNKIAVLLCEQGGSLSTMNGEGNPPLFYIKGDSKLIAQLQEVVSKKLILGVLKIL